MCAICGIIDFKNPAITGAQVEVMRDVMHNRGPEFGGLHIMPHAGLGHRRLKIIDLSPLGNQPMSNENGDIWVVFNGEIYNFQSLRTELEGKGHKFASHSDTEVIVHGYEEWGTDVISRLDGMFAIGLWDAKNQKLLLARDRFGKKPLYYRQQGSSIHFASDIKALTAVAGEKLEVDYAAVDCYLHHLGVPQQHAIYKGIAKVLPAHWMEFGASGVRSVRYWKMSFAPKTTKTEDELLSDIEAALRRAVRRRLVSDVPLGAFLSGGVDSSLIVALMSQESGKGVLTFSAGFDEKDFSELEHSKKVAQRYRTNHVEVMLKPDLLNDLPSLVWEYGEPFADSSAIPTFYVSQAAKKSVTVALTGDGGDEVFGGYDIARAAYYGEMYRSKLPVGLRQMLDKWLLSGSGLVEGIRPLHQLKTIAIRANADPAVRHAYSMAFNAAQRKELFHSAVAGKISSHNHYHIFDSYREDLQGLHLVDEYLLLTAVSRLPNDYLVKTDVASMKNALELRCPFLDLEVVELANRIPAALKVRGGMQKYLLKKLASKHLPEEILYRRKRGFSLPLEHWFRGDAAPLLKRFLPDGFLVRQSWFNKDVVIRYIDQHTARTHDHTHRIWSMLWLELWCRMFIEGSLQKTDSLAA